MQRLNSDRGGMVGAESVAESTVKIKLDKNIANHLKTQSMEALGKYI